MDKKRFLLPAALTGLALGPVFFTSAGAAVAAGPLPNIVEVAESTNRFNTLIAALGAAGLATVLEGPGPFTVFAPTDDAFAALPPGTVDTLLLPANQELLTTILLYHVVPGALTAADVVALDFAQTVGGQRVDITVTGSGGVQIDEANVLLTDVLASNGVIHVIDSVLMPVTTKLPETLDSTNRFNTLLAAVGAANLVAALDGPGPFTILAPLDTAFAALPPGTVDFLLQPQNLPQLTELLLYHVIPDRVYADEALAAGQVQTLEGSNVTFTLQNGLPFVNDARVRYLNRESTNGVFHVIDKVLMP